MMGQKGHSPRTKNAMATIMDIATSVSNQEANKTSPNSVNKSSIPVSPGLAPKRERKMPEHTKKVIERFKRCKAPPTPTQQLIEKQKIEVNKLLRAAKKSERKRQIKNAILRFNQYQAQANGSKISFPQIICALKKEFSDSIVNAVLDQAVEQAEHNRYSAIRKQRFKTPLDELKSIGATAFKRRVFMYQCLKGGKNPQKHILELGMTNKECAEYIVKHLSEQLGAKQIENLKVQFSLQDSAMKNSM